MSTANIRAYLTSKLDRKTITLSNLYRDIEGVGKDTLKEIFLDLLDAIDTVALGGSSTESIWGLVTKTSNQSGVAADTDITLDSAELGGTGISFASNYLVLPEGHTFVVEGAVRAFSFSGTSSYLHYAIVDDTNTVIPGTKLGVTRNVASNNYGDGFTTWSIVDTTGGDVRVKIRTVDANGTATIDVEGTGLRAYKI
jgi:hypothetical protein